MKRVTLHIDRLVLRGFKHEDRHGIAAGLQQELARMLSDPQVARRLAAGSDISRLRVGGIHITQDAKPRSVGTELARGIGKGMRK